jgi:hypothetical protein
LLGYAIGVAIGAMFGAFWAELAAKRLPPILSTTYDVITLLMVAALAIGAVRLVLVARRSPAPRDPVNAEQPRVGPGMWWLWMLVSLAEAVVIGQVLNLLATHHLHAYMLAAVAVIVGLHFFPLSRIFRAPEYMLAAVAMTAVGCIAISAMAAGFDLGGPARWNIVIGTVCATAIWGTCVRGLRQGGACGRYGPVGRAP